MTILVLSLLTNFYLYFLREPVIKKETVEIIKRDTVINFIKDYDTVYVTNTKYKDVYKYDTVHVNDIVYVRDTLYNYEFREPDFSLAVSAVRLDNYKLDIHARDTVTTVQTIYKTEYKVKKNMLNIGLQAGYGIGIESKHVEPYIGVGVQINLFQK